MAIRLPDGSIKLHDGRIVYADTIIQAQDLIELVPLIAPAPAWPFAGGVGGGGSFGGGGGGNGSSFINNNAPGGNGAAGADGAPGAPGAQGPQGSSGGGAQSLEQARAVGDTFTGGNVFWDNQNEAVFGKASGEANQDYGRVFFDHTNNLFVFDSTKDGIGVIRPISWQMGGVQKMELFADGGLVVGTATGGSQGIGTINVSSNYFVNGVAFGGSTDVLAWHNTGDSFGANKKLGSLDNFAVELYANNQEWGRIVDTGNNANWVGPRLLVGATVAFYPNADIIYIKKDLNDQLTFTLHNPNAGVAGATIICVNDLNNTGGINITGSGWPSPQDGLYPNEVGFISFGSACVVGTQTNLPLRFIVNNTELARFDSTGFIPPVQDTVSLGTAAKPFANVQANGINAWVGGEANPNAQLYGSSVTLGAGGATAIDTRMFRSGTKTLSFDDAAAGAVTLAPWLASASSIGSSAKPWLAMFALNFQSLIAATDVNPALDIYQNWIRFGPGGGSGPDCRLYRSGANELTFDDTGTGGVEVKFGGSAALRYQIKANGDMAWHGATPVPQQTGVPVTAAGIHAALVAYGLITA